MVTWIACLGNKGIISTLSGSICILPVVTETSMSILVVGRCYTKGVLVPSAQHYYMAVAAATATESGLHSKHTLTI